MVRDSAVTVFLLDDHTIVREGTRRLLEEGGIEVVGEAGTGSEGLAEILRIRPDVALLDINLPDCNGVEICRAIRERDPEIACLMLTAMADDDTLMESVLAGAAGFVLKRIDGRRLIEAVRTVADGGSLIDADVVARVMRRMREPATVRDRLAGLTDREREVLRLIGEGLTNRQIGAELFLSERTVKNYVSSMLAKLGLQRRTQAAVLAAEVFGTKASPGVSTS